MIMGKDSVLYYKVGARRCRMSGKEDVVTNAEAYYNIEIGILFIQ